MQFLKADYTEVWVPSVINPLIQFADKVDSLADAGIDTFGVEGLPAQPALIERLRAFDEVISWYGSSRIEFRDAMKQQGVNCVFHAALPPADCQLHATDFFCLQVGAPPGQVPELKFAKDPSRGSVVINPFSGGARKNWPLASYRSLASSLPMPVEWLAGPEEQLDDAVRFQDLGLLARWLSGARVYVGNDSGITHLAAAVGVPTVGIFGPTDPRVWRPRGPNVRHLWHQPLRELAVDVVRQVVLR